MAYRYDEDLEFLKELDSLELEQLVEILIYDKDGEQRNGNLATSDKFEQFYPNHKEYWEEIAGELQRYGANDFSTALRKGKGVLYKEILIDVCKRLKVNFNKDSDTVQIENNLLMKILEDSLKNMSDEQRKEFAEAMGMKNLKSFSPSSMARMFQTIFRAGGFKSYQLTVVIVNGVLKALVGRGLSFGANAALTKAMSIMTGPVGIAITAIWTAVDIAGPAYRVTIPAVIEVAALRQKYLYADKTTEIIESEKNDTSLEIAEIVEDKPIQNAKTTNKQNFIMTILSYKPILYFFYALALMAILILGKEYIFSVIDNNYNKQIVHEDTTTIKFKNRGFSEKIALDKDKATKVVLSKLKKLQKYKEQQSKQFLRDLKLILVLEFQKCHIMVNSFADWFFGYTTQYKILEEGAIGIVDKYRAGVSDYTIVDAATGRIGNFIADNYKTKVLRPYLLQNSLKVKIESLVAKYVKNKNKFVKQMDKEFREYLEANPDNLSSTALEELKADWKSNVANSSSLVGLHTKSGESGVVTIGGTIFIGKMLSGTIAKMIVAKGGAKGLVGKILAKFGYKKVATSMAAKIASAPLTMGVGALVGFAIDYGINKFDEVENRTTFVADVHENINDIKNILFYGIKKQNVVETIYNQDINMFKNFINNK